MSVVVRDNVVVYEGALAIAEHFRRQACERLGEAKRAEMGQFLTPLPVAQFMASMVRLGQPSIRLIDAGAGTGSLTAALIAEICGRRTRPEEIAVTAWEIDGQLAEYLKTTLRLCQTECQQIGIRCTWDLQQKDFIESAVETVQGGLFARNRPRYNCAVLNPPYGKINASSKVRRLLRSAGIETVNLYAAFVSLVIELLEPGGEIVAITPRSFCNGPYFRPFRKLFHESMSFRRIHLYHSRRLAFREDRVLQENIIFHAVKSRDRSHKVAVSSSVGPNDERISLREVDYDQVIGPSDPEVFIHIAPNHADDHVAQGMSRFATPLADLGLAVSTGRVVDFRAKEFLCDRPQVDTVPLIHPAHFSHGFVEWPKQRIRKPNALRLTRETSKLVVPSATYVLVKRFSAKEEKRRISVAIYDPAAVAATHVGFENHLNYYHRGADGVPPKLARGLAAFLSSTLVDLYFRQFSGHTQVNANDLRKLTYPTEAQLHQLSGMVGDRLPKQDEIDRYVEQELL